MRNEGNFRLDYPRSKDSQSIFFDRNVRLKYNLIILSSNCSLLILKIYKSIRIF